MGEPIRSSAGDRDPRRGPTGREKADWKLLLADLPVMARAGWGSEKSNRIAQRIEVFHKILNSELQS
jgi:hypothetical protein